MTVTSQSGSASTSGALAAQAARRASVQAERSDLPVRGSTIAPAASSTSSRKEGTPLAPNSGPLTAESTLSRSTAFSLIDELFCSAHSVEPTRPYSSASQLA